MIKNVMIKIKVCFTYDKHLNYFSVINTYV